MKKQRPSQITTNHLNRHAIEYRRRSTRLQTGEAASAAYPANPARRWGWPKSAIQVIDEQPGGNGVTMEGRPGYQGLCRQIAEGSVGLLLVSDVSRLTRSVQVWQQFVDLCRQHTTLIAVNGVLIDGADPTEDFMRDLLRLVAEFETARRADWLRARRAKAHVSPEPTV
ncbi:MAG: recombinase family protein [Candidatus Moduliflexus flocculans]|nr:recombinase family protein [Candidatus Moduliflexus flocculans]